MSKAEIIMDIINNLNGVIGGLEALAKTFDKSVGTTEADDARNVEVVVQVGKGDISDDDKVNEAKPTISNEPLTIEQLRAVLVEKSKSGKQAQVKALITSYGVERLTEIPASKYEEVMKKAGDI